MGTLYEKIREGHRLDLEDLDRLSEIYDPIHLGYLASLRPNEASRQSVYFHEHKYLSLRSRTLQGLSIESSIDWLLTHLRSLLTPSTVELRIVGIPAGRLGVELLLSLVPQVRERWPKLKIRAMSAGGLVQWSKMGIGSIDSILASLYQGGVTSIEGRGLRHVFKTSTRTDISHITFKEWLEIHRTAHLQGLKSDAVLTYGWGKSWETVQSELVSIRKVQDETSGFSSLIPLSQHLRSSEERSEFGVEGDLRVFSIVRCFVDNIEHIRASWGLLGLNVVQLALCFGADDLEGSLCHQRNSRIVGARPIRSINREELSTLVAKAGFEAIERPISTDSLDTLVVEKVNADELSQLLYKAESNGGLNIAESLSLVQKASLVELGACAGTIKGKDARPNYIRFMSDTVSGSAHGPSFNQTMLIDLGSFEWSQASFDELLGYLRGLDSSWHGRVVLRGIKGLWKLARMQAQSLESCGVILRQLGVVLVESSLKEVEDDLTLSEVRSTHLELHNAGLATVAKVELAAPYHGKGDPLWQPFLNRLYLMEAIGAESSSLKGVKIQPAKGANISPVEFFKAVALSRIVLHDLCEIIVPIGTFPLFHLPRHWDPESYESWVTRLAPLLAYFGATDLDDLGLLDVSDSLLQRHLESCGIEVELRDCLFRAV